MLVVQTLVRLKLVRQLKVLYRLRRQRLDKRKPLTDAINTLEKILSNFKLDDIQNNNIEQLRGYEGAGAAYYFPALASVFPTSLDFTDRNRRPPRDPVNACLSLGYTLLYAEAVHQIYQAGLDPFIGFLHKPHHGRESLAADIIEPLRPTVDQHVWRLFRERILRPENFTNDQGTCRMGKEARRKFYQEYEQQIAPLIRRTLSTTAYRFIRFLDQQ